MTLPARHPESETLAAFLDGSLPAAETRVVADHLVDCEECRRVSGEAARFERNEHEAASQPPARQPRWIAAAALVIAAGGASLFVARRVTTDDPIRQLAAASPRDGRRIEPRLAGFRWARLVSPSRGGVNVTSPATLKLQGVAGNVIEEAAKHPDSASDLHGAGVAYLLIGQNDDAVAQLARAAKSNDDPAVWNDLAAALYARAIARDTPSDLPEALHAADRAIEKRSPEGYFNRALILERMGDLPAAHAAWTAYLAIDPSTEWASEARAHLAELDRASPRAGFTKDLEGVAADPAGAAQLAKRWPEESRTWSEGPLLARWARAELDGRTADADRQLAPIRAIGRALKAQGGDAMVIDEVELIDRSPAPQREHIASAHLLYDSGRRHYSERSLAAAEKDLLAAAKGFDDAGSAMRYVALTSVVNVRYDQNRIEEAVDLAHALLARSVRRRYPAHDAEILWAVALLDAMRGRWDSALQSATRSLTTFASLGENFHEASVALVEIGVFDQTGNFEDAWRVRTRALRTLSATKPVRIASALQNAARSAILARRFESVLALTSLSIEHLEKSDDALLVADAFMQRARALHAVHRDGESADAVVTARSQAARLRDVALLRRIEADADVVEADLRSRSDPARSVGLANSAIALYEQNRDSILLPTAYLQRARALASGSDRKGAVVDLRHAIALIDEQRATVASLSDRSRFLDIEPDVYGALIDLLLDDHDDAGAFDVSEAYRARTLEERYPSRGEADVDERTLVEYALVPDGIAIFCRSPRGLVARRVPIDRRVLTEAVASFREAIERRAPVATVQRIGAMLYDTLLRPVEHEIASAGALSVVADRELQRLPFAALFDRERGSFAIESRSICLAPNARFRSAPPIAGVALIVAAAGERDGRLPEVAREAAEIAALYKNSIVLTSPSRDQWIAHASESSIIHFAGHARTSDEADAGVLEMGRDVLSAVDLESLRLRRAPLVTLAACGTLRGTQHIEGTSSLSASFLAAGASAVVGTLWDVDDSAASIFFRTLHRYVHDGVPPVAAMRLTQLQLLRSHDVFLAHPASWSGIEALTALPDPPAARRNDELSQGAVRGSRSLHQRQIADERTPR